MGKTWAFRLTSGGLTTPTGTVVRQYCQSATFSISSVMANSDSSTQAKLVRCVVRPLVCRAWRIFFVSAYSTICHFKYGCNVLIFGHLFTSTSQNVDVLSTFCGRKYSRLDVIDNTGY